VAVTTSRSGTFCRP